MIVFELKDGTFKLSSPDGECERIVPREEGIKLLRERGCPSEIISAGVPPGREHRCVMM
jgi:hypothetical protein